MSLILWVNCSQLLGLWLALPYILVMAFALSWHIHHQLFKSETNSLLRGVNDKSWNIFCKCKTSQSMILFMIYAISTIVIIRKKYYIPDCLVWPIFCWTIRKMFSKGFGFICIYSYLWASFRNKIFKLKFLLWTDTIRQ